MISYKPLFKFVILVTVFAIYSDFCSQVITTQRSVTHDSLRYINILTCFIYMHWHCNAHTDDVLILGALQILILVGKISALVMCYNCHHVGQHCLYSLGMECLLFLAINQTYEHIEHDDIALYYC